MLLIPFSDVCRFPHILLNDYPSPPHSYAAGRGGAFRAPRGHPNHNSVGNGLDAKMADLTIRDVSSEIYIIYDGLILLPRLVLRMDILSK